jgi:serine/threonine protein kinase
MQSPPDNQNSGFAVPIVPGYKLERQTGRGGYGVVYLARKISDGRYYAAKIVYREMFEDDEPYLREWAGIQNYKTLNCHSPFLLEIVDLFKHPDETFFCCVMELADDANGTVPINPASYKARTLKHELEKSGRRQRLPAKQCIEISLALAHGLQVLHNNRLVHRDVKPSNILFVGGVPKLGDIGLVTDEEASLTKFTPLEYAAPEDEHAIRADIYGFGKVLYEMCTGLSVDRFPSVPTTFKDWEDHALCLRLNRAIATACAVELRDRYSSCRDIIDELEAIRDGRKSKRGSKPMLTVALVSCVAVAVCATAVWIRQHPALSADEASAVGMTKTTVPSAISLIQMPILEGRWPVPSEADAAAAKLRVIAQSKKWPTGATFVERQRYLAAEIESARHFDNPADLYAYLQWLNELAIGDADHTAALRISDELSRRFRFDAEQINEMKTRVMEATARNATTPWHWTGVGKGSTRLGFRSLAMDDFANANRLLKAALNSVSRADNHLIGSNALFLQHESSVAEPWFLNIGQHVARLRSDPKHPEASTECGKYLCFAKNAWPQGLALLQNGTGRLANIARQELTGEKTPDYAAALGDAWLKLGNEDNQYRKYHFQRAAYWYGVATANGTNSLFLEPLTTKRQKLLLSYPPTPAVLRLAMKASSQTKIVVTSQAIGLTSLHGVEDVHVNWYRWGSFKAGGPDYYPNHGETRYLPSHVDFTRAKIARQHSSTTATAAQWATFPDRIEIVIDELADPAAFEWEITL